MRTEARRERVLVSAIGSIVSATEAIHPDGDSRAGSVSKVPGIRRPQWRLLLIAVLAVSGLAWDLWSKQAVFAQLNCPGLRPIWQGQLLGISIRFRLETTFNRGALWGLGQGQTWLFASLSFVAIGAIAYFLWNRQAIATWWLSIATGLLLAGTLGNLFDRLGLHGWKDESGNVVYAVRDFLDFWFFNDAFHWATFNFADTYLVIGACMLVIHSLWTPVEESPGAKSSATSA